MRSSTKYYLILLLGLALQSCDPVHTIRIVNSSDDTVTVTAKTTANFRIEEDYALSATENDNGEEFKTFDLPPKQEITCGTAIAGIEDELPFTGLNVRKGSELIITADGKGEVLELFEKKNSGDLTPYQIIIN